MFKYLFAITIVGVTWTIWPLTFIIPFWALIYPGFLWLAYMFHKATPFGFSGDDFDKLVKATEDKTIKEQLADTTLIRDIGAEA